MTLRGGDQVNGVETGIQVLTLSVRSWLTLWVSMTRSVTCGNGAKIGMAMRTTAQAQAQTPQDQALGQSGCSAVGAGAVTAATAGHHSDTPTHQALSTKILASALLKTRREHMGARERNPTPTGA
jgi:hypothetical protein